MIGRSKVGVTVQKFMIMVGIGIEMMVVRAQVARDHGVGGIRRRIEARRVGRMFGIEIGKVVAQVGLLPVHFVGR